MRVTDEEVMGALRDVVRERPDHVYEAPDGDMCRYVHREGDMLTPGCLVGTAFIRLGGDPEALERADATEGEWGGGVSIREVAQLSGLEISEEAAYALRHAQRVQDTGHTWSYALARAEEVFHG